MSSSSLLKFYVLLVLILRYAFSKRVAVMNSSVGDKDDGELARRRSTAEITKLEAEAEALRRRPRSRWSEFVPLLAGLGGLAAILTAIPTTIIQFQVSDLKVQEAVIAAREGAVEAGEVKLGLEQASYELAARNKLLEMAKGDLETRGRELEVNITELQAEKVAMEEDGRELARHIEELQERRADLEAQITNVRGEIANVNEQVAQVEEQVQAALATTTIGAAGRGALTDVAQAAGEIASNLARLNKIVYLQFKGDMSREIMQGLQDKLRSAGYSVPGIERIDRVYENEVRYFGAADELLAKDVASIALAYFRDVCGRDVDIPVKAIPASSTSPIEVWISLNCARPG